MKKQLIVIALVLVTNLIFAEIDVPKDVKKEISIYAVDAAGDDKGDFIRWQTDAYIIIEKELANSTLTEEEKSIVRKRLKAKYGVNYARQSKDLQEEMKIVSILNKEAKEKKEAEIRNEASKEELTTVVEDAKGVVPAKMMKHYEQEAQRLYPNNYYEQKRFIESSVNTYKMFNKQ